MKSIVFLILMTLALVGCVAEQGRVSVNVKRNTKALGVEHASVSSVQIIKNQLVITGTSLSLVQNVKVNGDSLDKNFIVESATATKIIANSLSLVTFDISKVFNLILSDANASATFAIDFSLCNATLHGAGFNCAIPLADNDVMAYDATSGMWKPRPGSGLSYFGTFDASTNPASGPTIKPAGAYYVISNDGMIGAVPFASGDWLVSNGVGWQKINNSSTVLSVFGRAGAITAQNGDYNLRMLGDVNLPPTPAVGKVLKFNGTKWEAGDDLSGGGAGSVTSAEIADGAVTDAKITSLSTSKLTGEISSSQITDGTIVNADINAAAGIDYSKINVPAAAIDYAKLNIGVGEIAADRISGLPVLANILAASIADGDTTHAPTGDAVYDALALKIGVNGGVLTSGTISGLTDPIGPTEVANKNFVDTQDALRLLKAGDTMTGVLTLDSDLKIKGGSNYVTIKGSATTANYNLILPDNDGDANQVLKTDGSGVLSWVDDNTGAGAFSSTGDRAVITAPGGLLSVSATTSTELGYVSGVTSSIQTQLTNKQAADATLTALAGYNSNGILVQTAPDIFTGRTITGVTNRVTVTNGNGVTANPLLDVSTTLLPSPLAGDAGKVLKATGADTSVWGTLDSSEITTALGFTPINKAGDSITSGTFTFNGAVLRSDNPVAATDVVNKQYLETFGQWAKNGSDINFANKVGIGTTTPSADLEIRRTGAWSGLRIASDQGSSIDLNSGVYSLNDGKIQYGSTKTMSFITDYAGSASPDMVILAGGKVGIGTTTPVTKLDVNGSIRLGVDATACSGTIAGAMRFNASKVEFCNGTDWAAFGVSGAAVGSSEITDGSITNADINAAAGIEYSKLNVPAAAIPLTALNATGTKDATAYLKGDNTWATFTTDVLGSVLTGLTLTNAPITAADTVLSAFGKLQKQVTDSAGAAMSGDLTGNLPAPTIAKIKGVTVSATAPLNGQFFKYTTAGTNWEPSFVTVTDLKSTALGNLFPGSGCAANQTLYYSVVGDSFSCVDINTLDANKITTGTIAAARLPASASYWAAATGGINYAGGKVGIGTNIPSDTLSVYKANAQATLGVTSDNTSTTVDRYPSVSVSNYDGNTTTGLVGNPSINLINYRGNTSASAPLKSGDPLGAVVFAGSTNNTSSYIEGAAIWGMASQDFTAGAGGSELQFYTTNNNTSAPTSKMTVSNDGNLGIGTSTPVNNLTISTTSSSLPATSGAAADGGFRMFNGNHALDMGLVTGGYGAWIQTRNNTNYSTKFNLYLNPRGGGVSIGESSAVQVVDSINTANGLLSVNGVNSTSSSSYGILSLASNYSTLGSGNILGEIRYGSQNMAKRDAVILTSGTSGAGGANGFGGYFSIKTKADNGASPTEKLRIDSNGNVGIGTTSPSAKLAVEGSGAVGIQIKSTGAAAIDTMNFINDMAALGNFWFAKGASASAAPSATDKLMNITNLGNVEIFGQMIKAGDDNSGVLALKTSPSGTNGAKNEVSMEFYADRSDLDTKSGFIGYESGTAFDLSLKNEKAGKLILGTNNSDNITILSDGKVGIGTTNPLNTLDVVGNIGTGPRITSSVDGANNAFWLAKGSSAENNRIGFSINADPSTGVVNATSMRTGGSDRLNIDASGNVGIGTTTPGYKLDVQGGGVNASGGYTQTSDIRLKTNIDYLHSDNALEKLISLRGIFYNWKDQEKLGSAREIGLIAQDVEKVFPEAIKKSPEGFLSVSYSNLISPVIESIKELHKRVTALFSVTTKHSRAIASIESANDEKDQKIKKLEAENAEMKARLDKIEKLLNKSK